MQHVTDYTTESTEVQAVLGYLSQLAAKHLGKAASVSHERRRELRHNDRLDTAQEALDEIDNEIEAMLVARVVGFTTSKALDFIDAIDAAYPVSDALIVANHGKAPEFVKTVATPEPEPEPAVVTAPRREPDDMRGYLMM
jgi:hypothetical protein